jgi:hypothetical protein
MKLVRLIKICLNESYSDVCTSKPLSDAFPIQNGLKQEYVLSLSLFNFALAYDVNLLEENKYHKKKHTSSVRW